MQLSETLRKVYVELIRRRSTVRVTPAREISSLNNAPVFLVGVYRSGTTLVRHIIDSHSNICCPPETDFINPLSMLVEEEYLAGFRGMGFDEPHVISRIRNFIIYFYENYAATHNKKRWADKSPSYIDSLGFISNVFPEAKYVMIYRHPLDQVHSFTRGGSFVHPAIKHYMLSGQDVRIAATRYWVEKVSKLLIFEAQHQDCCFHLIYEQLCDRPAEVIKSLLEFIGEPYEPQVLEFYNCDHDFGKEGGRAVSLKGFVKSSGNYKSWPRGLQIECFLIAKPLMETLGYFDK